jgi:hypothetical protein
MKTIYTITTSYYGNTSCDVYEDRAKAIEAYTNEILSDGRGEVEATRYDIPDGIEYSTESSRDWNGKERHGHRMYDNHEGIRFYATKTDEDGEEYEEEYEEVSEESEKSDRVSIYQIDDEENENNGKWTTSEECDDNIFATEDEAREAFEENNDFYMI